MEVVFDIPENVATISLTVITDQKGCIGVGNTIVHRPDLLDGFVSLSIEDPRRKMIRLERRTEAERR